MAMPRPQHRLQGQQSASRQFTDREPFLTTFDNALEGLTPGRWSVTNFHGVGGIGKTELIRKLQNRLRGVPPDQDHARPEVAHVLINFQEASNRHQARALESARARLHDGFGVSFPTFDVAFAIYWKLANPSLPLDLSGTNLLQEGEIAGDILALLADVPVIGVLGRLPRAADRVGTAAMNWWRERGQQELANLRDLDSASDVEAWLPAFFGSDVKAWLAKKEERRVVLFLDTHEALWNNRGSAASGTAPDHWVREWASHLDGVLVVICGRTKLSWAEDDPTWEEFIDNHLVGALAPEDADRFLQQAGVREADVRGTIVAKSEGLPQYLDLAVDTYEQIWRSEDRLPLPEEFDANLDRLLDRLLAYVEDTRKAALFVLAVPETFDREQFADLMTTFATGIAPTSQGLRSIAGFSFVEEPEPGRYALHALVRAALRAQDVDEDQRRVHRHLLERARAALREVDPQSIQERDRAYLRQAVVHGIEVLEPEELLWWFEAARAPFMHAGDWRALQPLCDRMRECAQAAFGADHPKTLNLVNDLGYLIACQNRYREAEPLHRTAYGALQQALGEDHPDTMRSLNDLAGCLHAQGRYDEAARLSQRALEIASRSLGNEHSLSLMYANNLAAVLQDLGRLGDAEALCNDTFENSERVLGAEHPIALRAAHNLAGVLEARGRHAKAEHLYRRALAVREMVLGVEHHTTLTTASSLANILRDQGHHEEAEAIYRRTLEARERVLGAEDATTLITVNDLAGLLQARKRYSEAEQAYGRALAGRERVLGENHPKTLDTVHGMAGLLRINGRRSEAERLYRRALDGRRSVLGADHPNTLRTARDFAAFLVEEECEAEADRLQQGEGPPDPVLLSRPPACAEPG